MRWYLLTDRKLKGYQLYGPFETPLECDRIAQELQRRGRIKSWSTIICQVPPRIENDSIITTVDL